MSRTLILDIDGTLIDSNDAHARAWVKAFASLGIEADAREVRPLIGMGSDQLVPTLTGINKDDARFEKLSEGWKNAFKEELPGLIAFSGTRELVQAAQSSGWSVVVATSGEAELAGQLLKLARVDDLLPLRVSSTEVQASKPEPDLIQAALKKAGAAPQDAWMIGDTRYDVTAAHKAGVKCAVVELGGNGQLGEADQVFPDLEAVTAWLRQA